MMEAAASSDAPKRRIAIIVQRYGEQINGGAELHARQWAQALKTHYQVDVLTSCALDYHSWAQHFPPGESWQDGCRVLRFGHPAKRKVHLPLRHKLRYQLRRLLARLGHPLVARPTGDEAHDGITYLRGKGPSMHALMAYLQARGGEYEALIFFTAFFHPAALGVLIHPQRSLLVPTLHDEKGMYLPHYHRVFRAPRAILYNTEAEQAVARRLYGNDLAPGRLCGVGIRGSPAAPPLPLPATVRAPFLLYVGRVDRSKGCAELFAQFSALRRSMATPLQLVVCGQWSMPQPDHPDLLSLGFTTDELRDALLAQAAALMVPSRHESLSLVLLEALAAGCPVIVNGHSDVLVDHVQRSGVGASYRDDAGWNAAVNQVLNLDTAQRSEWASRGRHYVADHYSWPAIIERVRAAIDDCAESTPLANASTAFPANVHSP